MVEGKRMRGTTWTDNIVEWQVCELCLCKIRDIGDPLRSIGNKCTLVCFNVSSSGA